MILKSFYYYYLFSGQFSVVGNAFSHQLHLQLLQLHRKYKSESSMFDSEVRLMVRSFFFNSITAV